LATEGRSSPSLKQLDEAVRAYAAEDPGSSIIVVVDATFEHRVSEAERDEVRQAMLNGEIVSPPAGAIGRGDAFVLRIAERTGAVVLSNDSFQEFHGEHPWLFHDGRLIGGKPVPGVGWIFTPRLPIRGPKSRAATAEAKTKKDPESAPAKAAELARAAKKAAKRAAKAKKSPKKSVPVDTSWPITPTMPPPGRAKLDPAFSSAIDEAVEEALHPPKADKARSATKKTAPPKGGKTKKEESGKRRDGKGADVKAVAQSPLSSGRSKKKRSAPPPAVNEPLVFINFVAAFSVGSTIQGEVVSFTSHGAMVDVSLPDGGVLHCYIPLTAMGSPPPTKARQVLKKGEVRPFVLAGLDPPRRVAELAIPQARPPKTRRAARAEPTPPAKPPTPVKESAAALATGKVKTAAPPTKRTAKKAGAPTRKAAAKSALTQSSSAKRAPARRAETAKKAPAKRAETPKKEPTAKASAKKAPAKRAETPKKAPIAKAPAKRPETPMKALPKKALTKKAPAKKPAPAKVAAKKVGATTTARKTPAKKSGKDQPR